MATTITNQSQTTYQFSGSGDILTADSNVNTITLEDAQNLVITKTANPTTFVPGSIITYTVTITNSSSSFLTGVRIIDNLGNNNLAYVVGSGSLTASGTTYPVSPVETTPLTFALQELNVGQSMTLTYRAQVIFNLPTTVNEITNSVQGIGFTSTGTINGFDLSTISRVGQMEEFTATKTASDSTVYPNQLMTYTIALANSGSTSATAIETIDELPSNFVVTSVSLKIGSGPVIQLDASDYNINSSNVLSIPSSTGPVVSVPSGETTLIAITGYFN